MFSESRNVETAGPVPATLTAKSPVDGFDNLTDYESSGSLVPDTKPGEEPDDEQKK